MFGGWFELIEALEFCRINSKLEFGNKPQLCFTACEAIGMQFIKLIALKLVVKKGFSI